MKKDTQYTESRITSVKEVTNCWQVTMFDGWSIWVPKGKHPTVGAPDSDVPPRAGETIRLYGKGIGFAVRGIVIGGRTYFYRTEEEQEEEDRKLRERLKQERKTEEKTFRAAPKEPLAPFKVKPGKEEEWKVALRSNSQDPYSYACMRLAAKWASLMEKALAAGESVADCHERLEMEADTEGMTGFMHGAARATLREFWAHGWKL